ncbi:diguanylate cyclase [Novosphingobium sp.]|uniref:diguanylate cyclase domain-containing protein n=1 Tax=Novosphingobium sp. TaxID=1874826 RepID=UPI0031E405B7
MCPTHRLDRREAAGFYAEESRVMMERLRAEAVTHGRPFAMEARIIRPDGQERWMRLSADVIRDNGRIVQLYGLKQDITEEKQRWEALRQRAEHDALTGLANRALFEERFLNAPLARPGLTPLGALVLVDLDSFKQVNDRFGHGAGDACLKAAAQRIAACFADALLVARIGGDEFAVLTGADLSPAMLEARVGRLLAELNRPILWRGHRLTIGASAGMAMAQDAHRYDAQALFAIADEALYAVKASGKGAMIMGDPACRAMRQASSF